MRSDEVHNVTHQKKKKKLAMGKKSISIYLAGSPMFKKPAYTYSTC